MTPEIPPLVVGIDGSERSRDALALAAQLADPGQHVLLIHVRRSGRPANRTVLQELLDPATAREMRMVSDASPARGLQAIAGESGASLIVVGSSHRSGIGRVFAGSVAESLLAGAQMPVAVAPRGYTGADNRLATIGCGFDGSPESEEALAWAAALARRRRARLEAVAVHSRIAFGAVSTTGAFGYQSADDVLRDELEQRMRTALAALADESEVSGGLLEGDAATELAAERRARPARARLARLRIRPERSAGQRLARARALRRVPGRRTSGGQHCRASRRPGRAGHHATGPRGVRSLDARLAV